MYLCQCVKQLFGLLLNLELPFLFDDTGYQNCVTLIFQAQGHEVFPVHGICVSAVLTLVYWFSRNQQWTMSCFLGSSYYSHSLLTWGERDDILITANQFLFYLLYEILIPPSDSEYCRLYWSVSIIAFVKKIPSPYRYLDLFCPLVINFQRPMQCFYRLLSKSSISCKLWITIIRS